MAAAASSLKAAIHIRSSHCTPGTKKALMPVQYSDRMQTRNETALASSSIGPKSASRGQVPEIRESSPGSPDSLYAGFKPVRAIAAESRRDHCASPSISLGEREANLSQLTKPQNRVAGGRPRVVVVGGGFGGLHA